ncbi:hypothetical protein AWJ14_20905 [Hoeflea olei]|uniref:Uncharacterized protein n=1 Tax=Hoeflea olei TaxID=1480615 RepID=A0A1C1YZM3_9HYPH|nr:hypothetical protein AWJ14_20905 [Hoeflea olei]
MFLVLFVAGCQTASLEDAAPKAAPAARSPSASGIAPAEAAALQPAGSAGAARETAQSPAVIRRNPGFASVVPIEKTAPVEKKAFVESGARQTGTYPTIGTVPQAANTQMTTAEKLAAEAEMAKLLKDRASTPSARAQYEARLRELRALAASHGSDTQQQIEN